MSTVLEPQTPKPGSAADPFRYGWRYVKRTLPDGTEEFDQVPLTLEDVLHPQEEDFIVHNDAHDEDRYYLKHALRERLSGREPPVLVLSDHRVAWDEEGRHAHGPDIVVIPGVGEWNPKIGTFNVALMGKWPVLIIELVSPDHRHNDVVVKVEEYHQARVPYYVIVDAREEPGQRILSLIGYRYTPDAFVPMALDPQGRLWLEPVQLWLGVEGGRVVLWDVQGNRIGTYAEVNQARREAEAQAQAETARACALDQARREAEARAQAETARACALEREMELLRAKLREVEAKLPPGTENPRSEG